MALTEQGPQVTLNPAPVDLLSLIRLVLVAFGTKIGVQQVVDGWCLLCRALLGERIATGPHNLAQLLSTFPDPGRESHSPCLPMVARCDRASAFRYWSDVALDAARVHHKTEASDLVVPDEHLFLWSSNRRVHNALGKFRQPLFPPSKHQVSKFG